MYRKNGVINSTIFRPVLEEELLVLVDRQALPPYSWCRRCGGEVYRRGETLCAQCKETERME